MRMKLLITVLICAVLVSCTPSATAIPTKIFTPTLAPTPVPTTTITPSPTPLPQSSFSAKIVGEGEHGAMVEIVYNDDWSNLDDISIQVSIMQNGESKDNLQKVNVIDGRHLVEMTDAKYSLGKVSVDIMLTQNGTTQTIQKDVEYSKVYPFIFSLFQASDFTNNSIFVLERHRNNDESEWYAKDFWLESDTQSAMVGIPIYMPFSFRIVRIRAMTDICQPVVNYNIWIENPYTGYTCQIGHIQPGELIESIIGNSESNLYGSGFPTSSTTPIVVYDPTRILATVGAKDGCSGMPHLHFECQSPYRPFPFEASDDDGQYFGYSNNLRNGFCQDSITPCEQSRNIEMNNFLISTWVIPE